MWGWGWGWEAHACDICGAADLCDCLEQMKAINSNLKRVRSLLVDDLLRTREKAGVHRNYDSSDFIVMRNAGSRRSLLLALASEIPEVLHESWMMGEVADEELEEINHLRDEAKAPLLTRWWRGLGEED